MSKRREKPVPDWAARERAGDLGWIRDNLDTLWPLAQEGYQALGRGAVVVDTTITVLHQKGIGHPSGYFDHQTLAQLGDQDTQRLVKEYEPDREFVTTLIKPEDRLSSYRLGVLPRNAHREKLSPR